MNLNIEMTDASSKELIEKLISCKTADEFIAFAKAQGFELTFEQADELLKAMSGEISDEMLGAVTGGAATYEGAEDKTNFWSKISL